MAFETILYAEDGPIGWLTLNRPDDGNMFTAQTCHEVRDCIEAMRHETRTRVLVLSGAGDRFFCIGGRKTGLPDTRMYAGILPTLEMYDAIDRKRTVRETYVARLAAKGNVTEDEAAKKLKNAF